MRRPSTTREARSVECPVCQAKAGEPCVSRGRDELVVLNPAHALRHRAYEGRPKAAHIAPSVYDLGIMVLRLAHGSEKLSITVAPYGSAPGGAAGAAITPTTARDLAADLIRRADDIEGAK